MLRRRNPRRLRILNDAEIVALYVSGLSLDDVAQKAGCSSTTVKDRVVKAGVPMRRRGGPAGTTHSYLFGHKKTPGA